MGLLKALPLLFQASFFEHQGFFRLAICLLVHDALGQKARELTQFVLKGREHLVRLGDGGFEGRNAVFCFGVDGGMDFLRFFG